MMTALEVAAAAAIKYDGEISTRTCASKDQRLL